jgi:serine protease Do
MIYPLRLLPLAPILALTLLTLPATGQAKDPSALQSFSEAFVEVAAKAKPSVVTIYSEKTIRMPRWEFPFGEDFPFRRFFEGPDTPRRTPPRQYEFKQTGMGSGVIVDKKGHILTNHHVIDDTDEIKVKLANGATYDAEIVGTDRRTDLAVLKLKGQLPADLTPATLGESETLRVGEWVLAIGAPFGFAQTVTAGIISAKGRSRVGMDRDMYEDFIQTDAAINRGNSGGPLMNLRGEVIGINTAIISPVGQNAGVGFAIPIDMAKRVLRDLIASGKVTRGYLGIGIQDLTLDLAKRFGVPQAKGALVTSVSPNTPAEKAGLKPGDVILRYSGKDIEDTAHLRNLVAGTDPGKTAELVVRRDGKERTLSVTVGQLPDTEPALAGSGTGPPSEPRAAELGLTVEPLTDARARALGYDPQPAVVVTHVRDNSPAEQQGIRPGDLILEVNRRPVATADDFDEAVGATTDAVLLLIKNKQGSRFVVVPVKNP